MKYLYVLLLMLICCYAISQDNDFQPTRPGYTSNAYVIGYNRLSVDYGTSISKLGSNELGITYEPISNLDLRIDYNKPYTSISTFTVSGKYKILNNIAVQATYVTGYFDAIFIVQQTYNNCTVTGNIGLSNASKLLWSGSVSYNLTDKVSCTADYYIGNNYDLGIAYMITKDLQLDCSYYKYNILNFGISYRL